MGEYWLPEDAPESEHFSRRSELLEKSLGYLLHPSIPTRNANLKIAGVGRGSGVFLQSLRSKLPSATLDGYRVSEDEHQSDPGDISFHQHRITDQFPEATRGTYDVVYCCFVGSGVPESLWHFTIANLVSLLKPGGHIQWIEPDHIVDATIGHREDKPAQKLQNLFDFTVRRASELNLDRETMFAHDLRSNIATLVPAVREEIVPCDFMYDDPGIRIIGIQNSLDIFGTALQRFLSNGGQDEELGVQSKGDADELMRKVKQEMLDGDGIYRFFWRVVIGKAAA